MLYDNISQETVIASLIFVWLLLVTNKQHTTPKISYKQNLSTLMRSAGLIETLVFIIRSLLPASRAQKEF